MNGKNRTPLTSTHRALRHGIRRRGCMLVWAAAPVAALCCRHAAAATRTWTGGGGDSNWQTPANWGGAAPVAGDSLVFAGSTNISTTNNFPAGTLFNSLAFDPSAAAFTLANNRITLGGNITDNSALVQTISLPMTLSTNSVFTVPTAGNLAISGVISGAGQGFTQGVISTGGAATMSTGAGTTTLTGQNTYTGATRLTSGVVAIDYNAPGAPTGVNTILSSASTLGTGGRGTFLMNGHVSNATAQGVSGLTVNANTNSSIIVNSAGGATTLNLGAITGASAGSVDFQNFANTTTTTTTPNGPNGIMGAYYTAGTGSGGGESWAVSAASGGNPGAITRLTTFDTTFTPGTNEDVFASSTSPAGTLTLNSLRVSGAGALTLTLGGDTTITSGGILNTRVQGGNGPVITGGTLTSATGELVINNRTQDNFSVNSKLVGNMNLTIVNQQTAGSAIDPSDANNDNNDGSVILNNAASSFIGTITVAAGRLQVTGNVNSLGNAANPIVVAGGLQGGGQFQDNNLNLDPSGTHTITISGLGISEDDGGSFGAVRVRNKLSSPIVLAGTSRIGVGVNAGGTYAGAISGNFELWLDSDLGTRPLILANSGNTWSGGTRIERGTIQMGIANALPQNTIVTFGSLIPATEFYSPEGKTTTALNPTLNLNGFNTTIGGAQVFNGDTALTATTITNNSLTTPATLTVNSALSTTFAGSVTNASGATLNLAKSGSGTFTLTGNSTYAGDTTVSAGVLKYTNPFTTGASVTVTAGSLVMASNGTFNNVLKTSAVSVTGGKIDLVDNKMIVAGAAGGSFWDGSAYTGVAGLVQSGYNGGDWAGIGIVTSQSNAISPNVLTALVTISADDAGLAGGSFGGQTANSGDQLIMYTWGGDANMDGTLNGDDYFQIDSHFNQDGLIFGYFNGDFNYDGAINGDDYFIIDSNFNAGSTGTPFPTSGGLTGVAAVPEPAAAALMALLACGLSARPRRSRR